MAQCKKIYRQIKRVCSGSLNKKIKLKIRAITAPSGDSVDFGETFTDFITTWAMVQTKNGIVVFDDTNTAQKLSHEFYIRYIPNITFEKWLEYDGKNYNILNVENLNEENRFYLLQCNERGSTGANANLS